MDEFSEARVQSFLDKLLEHIDEEGDVSSFDVWRESDGSIRASIELRDAGYEVPLTQAQADYLILQIKRVQDENFKKLKDDMPSVEDIPFSKLRALATARIPSSSKCALATDNANLVYTLTNGPSYQLNIKEGDILVFVSDLVFGGYCGYYSERSEEPFVPSVQISIQADGLSLSVLPRRMLAQLIDAGLVSALLLSELYKPAEVISLADFRKEKE